MGSGASTQQPISPTLKKQKSKIVIMPVKQKQVEEPPKPTITKLVVKEIDAPRGLSQKMQNQIQSLKKQSLMQFQNRFLLKVSQNQIRLVFTEQPPLQNVSQISSKHHGIGLKKLTERCSVDLSVYRQICLMKMNCIISQKVKHAQKQLQTQSHQQLKQTITIQCNHMIQLLIGEIEGKSSIWHSLNLTQRQKIRNLVNYLHEEGVDSEKIQIFKRKEEIINDI